MTFDEVVRAADEEGSFLSSEGFANGLALITLLADRASQATGRRIVADHSVGWVWMEGTASQAIDTILGEGFLKSTWWWYRAECGRRFPTGCVWRWDIGSDKTMVE